MKRNITLWLAFSASVLLPAFALQAPTTGKLHGHVTNPTGASQAGGTVSLIATTRAASGPGLSAQTEGKGTATVDANGDYTIEAPPGTYTLVYRSPGMAADKQADQLEGVKVLVGQDTVQDVDMSRKEYIEKLPPDQQKQLEELRKHNSEAMKANEVIKNLNNDLKVVTQDIKDADAAKVAAQAQLGATASSTDVAAKEKEIKLQKYGEAEALMLKDTQAKPDASVLWAQLGQAQVGLGFYDKAKYDDAIPNLKKALDLEANSKKPNIAVQGLANSELGEIYARQGKVPEANQAFADAAKVNPTQATFYLRNEAVIFFQTNNADAQVAAANEALKTDPKPAGAVLHHRTGPCSEGDDRSQNQQDRAASRMRRSLPEVP